MSQTIFFENDNETATQSTEQNNDEFLDSMFICFDFYVAEDNDLGTLLLDWAYLSLLKKRLPFFPSLQELVSLDGVLTEP